ncbi:MAG: hypothetical protein R8K49_04850 [Mariprofundaceae bacterium]
MPTHSIAALQKRLAKLQAPPFHILLVDDPALIVAVIKEMLARDGDFILHHCKHGR